MKKLKLAIIGCGGMAQGGHAKSFSEVSDVIEVTACCDIEIEKAKAMAESMGVEHYAADYHDILEYCDAVMLVLPHHLHFPIGMECLKAGKHVLCEKPMCISEQECIEMTEFAEKQGLVLMVAYVCRYMPIYNYLKNSIDDKRYGDIFQLSIWTEQLTMTNEWSKNAATLGGGQLFSHGCHYIDLLLWFLGEPKCGTHVGTKKCTPWMDREGTSNVSIEFESGALGYHFGTWGAKGSHHRYCTQAHFEDCMLELNVSDGLIYEYRWNEEPKLVDQVKIGKNTYYELRYFAECVLMGKPVLTDGFDSLQGLRVIWELYEAEEKGIVADLRGLGIKHMEPFIKMEPAERRVAKAADGDGDIK